MPREKKQHLKRRPDGRFACRYKDQWFYGETEDEALKAREDYKQAMKAGMLAATNCPTLTQFANRWLPIAKPTVSAKTYQIDARLIEILLQEIGWKALDEVTPMDIKMVYSTRFLDMSDSYIKQARQIYTGLFDAAVSDGLIKSNPAKEKSARPHKGTSGSHRAITDFERYWINTYCRDHRCFPAVMAMLYEGVRPPEAKAMDIDRDVNFSAGTVTLSMFAHSDGGNGYIINSTGKTAKSSRTIPLFPPFEEAITGKHGPLVTCAGGEPLTVQAWKRLWNSYVTEMETAINGCHKRWYGKTKEHKAMIEAGKALPPWITFDVKPYDLRHSFATMCRDNGIELNTVVQWMGHADAQMILRIYDEVSDDRSMKEAEKLKKVLIRSQNGSQNETETLKAL